MRTVSIVICTRNREESLKRTLQTSARIRVPDDLPAELLVVDNGSTDGTAEVVANAVFANLPVRYVWEPRTGQCHARNTGIRAARGDIILFTDDDVRPPAGWIEGMCRPIADGRADAVAGGVRLAPHLEAPWLVGDLRGWLACTDGLIDPVEPQRLVGANMAFGRHVLEAVPSFDTELGPGALGFFDDTLFAEQLLRAGFRIAGALDVAVEHHPDMSRFGHDHLLALARKLGSSSAYRYRHWCHGRIRLAPAKIVYYLTIHLLHEVWSLASCRRQEMPARNQLNANFQLSLVWGYLRERRRPPNYQRYGLVKRRAATVATRGTGKVAAGPAGEG